MTAIQPGRFTATLEGDFVVFLIGMRINRPFALRSWLRVAMAMPRMQRELTARPESGCLAAMNWFGRTTLSVQYWRDFDSLNAYARDPDQQHLPAWRDFNRAIRDNGAVGIWHETYAVQSDRAESIYGNMPRFGLAAAFGHAPITAGGQSAAKRIGASAEDEPALPPY